MTDTPETLPEDPNPPWPNQMPVVDGLVPVEEVSQDPDLFADDDTDLEMDEFTDTPEED